MTKPPAAKRALQARAKANPNLPWREPGARADLDVQLNTRQPERLMLKVEYVALVLGLTKKDLVEQALTDLVDRELKKRGLPT